MFLSKFDLKLAQVFTVDFRNRDLSIIKTRGFRVFFSEEWMNSVIHLSKAFIKMSP